MKEQFGATLRRFLGIAALGMVLGVPGQTPAAPVLFGAAYSGSFGPASLASLYSIDPNSGAGTLIGAIGFTRVSGMDFDPSGVLYAVGVNASDVTVVLTINTTTGAGTEVAVLSGFETGVAQDISFRSDGTLFAYQRGEYTTIDKATGVVTSVGSDPLGFPLGNATAFSPSDVLYTANEDDVKEVDQTTGGTVSSVSASYPAGGDPRAAAMDFDSTGQLWATVISGPGGIGAYLATIDPVTGVITSVGTTVVGLDALAVQVQSAVPEPATVALLCIGLAGLGFGRRKRV